MVGLGTRERFGAHPARQHLGPPKPPCASSLQSLSSGTSATSWPLTKLPLEASCKKPSPLSSPANTGQEHPLCEVQVGGSRGKRLIHCPRGAHKPAGGRNRSFRGGILHPEAPEHCLSSREQKQHRWTGRHGRKGNRKRLKSIHRGQVNNMMAAVTTVTTDLNHVHVENTKQTT